MPTLTLDNAPVITMDVDAVVVAVRPGSDGPEPAAPEAVDADVATYLTTTLRTLGAKGSHEEVTKIAGSGHTSAPLIAAVGLGAASSDGSGYDRETLRRAAGAAVRTLAGTDRVGIAFPGAGDDGGVVGVAEGALLGAYAFDRYRTSDESSERKPVQDIRLYTTAADDGAAAAAVQRAHTLARAVWLTRDLVNTPASDLHPTDLADIASTTAGEAGLEVEVLDEDGLRDGGYGGLVGVGQGAADPPRLVRLHYTHPEATRTIALVGKGITFDTGGLSLKPVGSMETMKTDMGGAAATLGAMSTLPELAPKVNVIAYLCLAENMPSGSAQRPSDVLHMYGGKTVEVLNTDAEGRLVMADAIARAGEEAEVVVDTATLTGAQVVALGGRVAGVMAGDDGLRDALVRAADRAGDPAWPMPLPADLRKSLDSMIADIANVSSGRDAGMLKAGLFLKEFVPDGVRWGHLDIAGPSFNPSEPHGYTPKGATGVATRTLIHFVEAAATDDV